MVKLTIDQALKKAVEAHKVGAKKKADRMLRAILKAHPNHPDANHNMGVLSVSMNKVEAALPFFKTALEANFSVAQFWYSYISALISLGRFHDAKSLLTQATAKGAQGGPFDDLSKQISSLEELFQTEIERSKELLDRGEFQEVIDVVQALVKTIPNLVDPYIVCGAAHHALEHYDLAIDSYKRAIKIRPDYVEAYNSMGISLRAKMDFDDAIDSYKRAIKIKPDYAEAYNNMGSTLTRKGDFGGAIDSYKRALDIKPDFPLALHNLGSELLRDHNFEQGFELLEHRWKIKQDIGMELVTSKPLWGGERDQIVFVWAEQGIGDEIMFFSLIPELYSASSKLIVQCDQRLIPLFQRSFPKDIIYESRRSAVTEDLYDFHTPIGSLARIFRTSLESFRKTSDGYLRHDGVKTTQLRQKLLSGEAETLIGVNWKTASPLLHACERNIALHEIAEVLNSPKVQLVCLQYGDVSDEIDFLKEEFGINVLQVSEIDNRNDIDDLASLIMACDKIVSTTNATVHLAGSLGADVRVLLPFSARWIWGTHKSPRTWYNSITQYRQHLAGDWSGALQILSKDIKNENLEK